MVAVTSDEKRREVAENLRYLTIRPHIRYKEQFFDELAEVVVGFDSYRDFNDVLNKLADLIEPEERTCRMVEVKTGEVADYSDTDEVIFHCTSCHAERGIFSYDEDGNVYSQRPEYCPNCRAKVVE